MRFQVFYIQNQHLIELLYPTVCKTSKNADTQLNIGMTHSQKICTNIKQQEYDEAENKKRHLQFQSTDFCCLPLKKQQNVGLNHLFKIFERVHKC